MLKRSLLAIVVSQIILPLGAQTLYTENFEGGGAGWALNSGDMGTVGNDPMANQWIINNVYQGGTWMLGGFFPVNIQNTPQQPGTFTNGPTSNYLHITFPESGILNANYLAGGSAFGYTEGAHFAKMTTGINTTGFTGVTLEFYYLTRGGVNKVYYSTDGGNTWTQAGTNLSYASNWTLKTITNAAFDNKPDLRFAFYFDDTQGTQQDPPFCVDEIKVYVPTQSQLNANFTASQTNICVGQCINFTDQSSGNPTSWSWTFAGATPGTSTQQNPTNICYNTPGQYTVTLTVSNGSSQDTETKTAYITVNPAPNVTITASQTQICPGQQVTLTAGGASTYSWNQGLGNSNPVTVSPPSTTTYSVTGTDNNNCTGSASINIVVTNEIQVQIDTTLCPGGSIVIGGQIYNSPGTYKDTTLSVGGCDSITTIQINAGSVPNVILPSDTAACIGQSLTLVPIVVGSYNVVQWSDGINTLARTVNDSGYYTVTVSNTCGGDMATIHVQFIDCGGDLFFPNVFTPNGDAFNQYFSPIGANIEDYELYIYNRWGNLVFKTSDVNQPWDGKYKGKDVPEGVYFYVAKYKAFDPATGKPEKKQIRGSVTLIR
ncbi:MAG: gliding motility-associated C-terminal domain-containing protein [Bacteroidales bacterium]|nr:gliding motility-associated C-terminal domain-containing protein [Bacteroidales bacterium]